MIASPCRAWQLGVPRRSSFGCLHSSALESGAWLRSGASYAASFGESQLTADASHNLFYFAQI